MIATLHKCTFCINNNIKPVYSRVQEGIWETNQWVGQNCFIIIYYGLVGNMHALGTNIHSIVCTQKYKFYPLCSVLSGTYVHSLTYLANAVMKVHIYHKLISGNCLDLIQVS